MSRISVTEVRNAMRCPRIFALGRRRDQPVRFPVGSSTLGGVFHRLVERLSRGADVPPPELTALSPGADAAAIEVALRRWLIDLLAHELEASPLLTSMPAEVDDLAEALRELARYLSEAIAGGSEGPAARLRRFLAASEVEVEQMIDLPGGDSVLLRGRIDALHEPDGAGVQVVEYKLSSESDADVDRAQVALYRYLLRSSVEVDAAPVILRFDPALRVTRLEAEEADTLVDRALLPLASRMAAWLDDPSAAPPTQRGDLCPACPLRAECSAFYGSWLPQRDQPPSGAARPRPTVTGEVTAGSVETTRPPAQDDREGRAEAERVQKLVVDILRRQHVPAESKKPPMVSARLITVEVSGRRSIRKIDAAAEDVIHQLAAEHDYEATFRKAKGLRLFEVVRRQAREVDLPTLLDREREWLAEASGRFVLGEATDGSVLKVDLGDPNCCHLLVGGSSGSGKSVLLRAIASSLVHYHPPASLRLTLVDPKRVSFRSLEASLQSHLAHPIIHDGEKAIALLEDLCDEMEERYAKFEVASVQDIDEYNQEAEPADRMARHVVIVDEFGDLTASKVTKEPFLAGVMRLGAKARAAGIHLVLATQHPSAKVVPGAIKANLPGRVALRVSSVTYSRIVLDAKGAEQLLGKGDLLAELGRGLVRGQSPLV